MTTELRPLTIDEERKAIAQIRAHWPALPFKVAIDTLIAAIDRRDKEIEELNRKGGEVCQALGNKMIELHDVKKALRYQIDIARDLLYKWGIKTKRKNHD